MLTQTETFEVGETVFVAPWDNWPIHAPAEYSYGSGVGIATVVALQDGGQYYIVDFGFISNKPKERILVSCLRVQKLVAGNPAPPPTASVAGETTSR